MNARPVAAQRPPKTENWVHQLGRVAPERYCTPEELPRAIRETVARLLDDADARREELLLNRQGGQNDASGSLVSGFDASIDRR